LHSFIDIHSHILPGIDDGINSLSESLETIKELKKLGFGTFFTTPHQKEGSINPPLESIKAVFDAVKDEVGKSAKLYSGVENFFDTQLHQRTQNSSIPTMGDSKYVLFEVPPFMPIPKFEEVLFQMSVAGYDLILAHIERYQWLDLSRLKDLSHTLKYQVNITSFLEDDTEKTRYRRAVQYLEAGIVDYIATDLHSISLVPKIEKGIKWIDDNFGSKILHDLLVKNPKKIEKAAKTSSKQVA
jgi:protein-tyrosine phosphatase